MQIHGLGAADMVGDVAIARGLADLALQALELAFEGGHDVLEPDQVVLGRAQAQLGLMPAGMEARDARRLLEQRPPVGRPRRHERADAPLADDGRRARPRGGIREQQGHIPRPHVAPVDAVVGSRAPLDAPAHLEIVRIVEGRGRPAIGVVELEGDLGDVPRRPLAGAAEDHIVHLAAAHRLGRAFRHHPAQRFHQVRLAAAVGADDTGQARLDEHLDRIDEGLETGEAKLCELDQGAEPSTAG